MRQGTQTTRGALSTLILCLIIIGGIGGLLQNAEGAPDVIYPETLETLTTTATITFDYSTETIASAASANIWISAGKGTKDNVVEQNIDLITNCGFAASDNWVEMADSEINLDPGGIQRWQNSIAFYAYGEYHIIFMNFDDTTPPAYTWNGSSWVSDDEWGTGLTGATTLQGHGTAWVMDGDIYLLYGEDDSYNGFKYNTTTNQWDVHLAIANGLGAIPASYNATYYVFYHNSNWRLIEEHVRYTDIEWYMPYHESYTWNTGTDQWDADSAYITDFNMLQCNECTTDAPGSLSGTVFTIGTDLYALLPPWSNSRTEMVQGTIAGMKWSGSAWEIDADINAGLAGATDINAWYAQFVDLDGIPTLLETSYDLVADSLKMDRYIQADGYYNTTTATQCTSILYAELFPNGNYYVDIETSATLPTSTETGSDSGFTYFTIDHEGAGDPPIQPVGTTNKTGIYITAADWSEGTVSGDNASDYSGFLHNWRSFAAGSASGYAGRILIDGAITTTCNYAWDCLIDLNTGSHTYTLYSSNGGYQYSGAFNVDANTTFIKIYAPITHNVFKLWETETEQTALTCSDIYSVSSAGNVTNNKRISTGLYVGVSYLNWDTNQVVPQNCYSSENVAAQYPFPLPGQVGTIEPAVFMYSGENGLASGELFGLHFLNGGIIGSRNRNGYTNFYDLHSESAYYVGSGSIFSGRVERRQATAEDGYYSPITAVVKPNMNIDSALYGDANYNPGDFALNDSITCEASLLSGGYVAYDVNMLLISDQNAIYGEYSFSPYQKYNSSMAAEQDNGAFNIVWHTFENANIGHTGTVQCAIQVSNELGYDSGWVYSAPRVMHSSNLTTAGGMNVFVKYEGGTTSYMGHYSPFDSDLNNIDIYNWYHQPYYWGYDTSENPLTLFEGDGVIAQTWDRNASRSASKSFDIDRGDAFDITLYLADPTDSDQSPVVFSPQMYEQSAFGDRVYCKNNFYDKDLDWNSTKFMFWTSNEGGMTNPLCEKTIGYAYTTNCNPVDSPCFAPGATETIMNECGSDNDCYTEAYFSKRGCASLASGEVTGYCGMRVYDNNGNNTLAQATVALTVPTYAVFALCESYTLLGSEKDSVIFTDNEKGYVECLVGLDNVSEPTDLNWSVVFEGKTLSREETIHDDYMDQDYFMFRIEATDEIDALARAKSTDGETWEGDGTVFVQHPVYGSEDTAVHLAVVLVGKREGDTGTGEYGEEQFSQLWDWVSGFGTDLMTNPIGTVQARFFEVLVLTIFAIIFVPLILIGMVAAAKIKKSKGG